MNKTKVLQFVVKYKLLEVSRRLMEWLGDFLKKNVKDSRVLSMKSLKSVHPAAEAVHDFNGKSMFNTP